MKIMTVTRDTSNNIVTIQTQNPNNTYTLDIETADDLAFQLLQTKYYTDVIRRLTELYNSDQNAPQNDNALCNDIANLYTILHLKGDTTKNEALSAAIEYYKARIQKAAVTAKADIYHANQAAWWQLLSDETKSKTNSIYERIEKLRKTQTIYPPSNAVFRAFELTHPNNVKAVIIGQDPYHEENEAMGLAFSVNDGVKIPPSLRNIYTELENDLGIEPPSSGNLTKWAENGVLLLNSVLTVQAHIANSHKSFEWQTLTREILRICIQSKRPIVYMCWGRQAYETLMSVVAEIYGKPTDLLDHQKILKSSHPSPFSAYTSIAHTHAFMGSHQFSEANRWLASENVKPIDWTL